MTKLFVAGVDVGSSATKAVILDLAGNQVAKAIVLSGMDFAEASKTAMDGALKAAGASLCDLTHVVASGYGRKNVVFANSTKTEIACHARGVFNGLRRAMSIVDIGGQDNKIIRIDDVGNRIDFKMNRKCAAGTGAFLEEIARKMGISVEEMEPLARKSTKTVEIGSFCTVFSATEILGLVRKGEKKEDIAKGAFRSVVKRVTEMDRLIGQVAVTGGVIAHNPLVVELLSEAIGGEVYRPPDPQFTGALGAALYAVDECESRR